MSRRRQKRRSRKYGVGAKVLVTSLAALLALSVGLVVFVGVGLPRGLHGARASPSQQGLVAEVPISPGDYVTLYYFDSIVLPNGSLRTFYVNQQVYEVTNVSYPFVTLSSPNGTLVVPLFYLWVPPNFNETVGLPVVSLGVPGQMCIPVYRYDLPYLYGSEPGTCTEAVVSIHFNYTSGFVYHTFLLLSSAGGPIREDIFVTAISFMNKTPTRVVIPSTGGVCYGPYSPLLEFTAPGGYAFNGTVPTYIGTLSAVANRTPLVIVEQDQVMQGVWAWMAKNYRGYAIVISPLMKDFSEVPYLSEVLEYGVVYVPRPGAVLAGQNATRALTMGG